MSISRSQVACKHPLGPHGPQLLVLCHVSYGFLSLLPLAWSPSLLVGEEIESQKVGTVHLCSTFTSTNLDVMQHGTMSRETSFCCVLSFFAPSSPLCLIRKSGSKELKNPPAMQETWVRSLGWKDPLEKEKDTHSSILA